ncbi:hypothetical protein QQ045_022475 [Rhodiola kirilowii]
MDQHDDQKLHGKMDNLLEECWFFENLLLRRTTRCSRCNSDTSSSSNSNSNQEDSSPSVSEVYAEIIKQEISVDVVKDIGISKLSHKNRPQGLSRAPSLPANMSRELKEECVPKLSKLSRQTSLTPKNLPPIKGQAKGRISRTESLNMEAINEMRNGYIKYQKNTRKTTSALEFEEIQGFKDLGFNFDTKDLSPKVVSILPGLQEKNKPMSSIDDVLTELEKAEAEDHNHCRRKPYLSEAWQLQRSSSTIPNWDVKKSSEDMKAQLKSWARTVASNAR